MKNLSQPIITVKYAYCITHDPKENVFTLSFSLTDQHLFRWRILDLAMHFAFSYIVTSGLFLKNDGRYYFGFNHRLCRPRHLC